MGVVLWWLIVFLMVVISMLFLCVGLCLCMG